MAKNNAITENQTEINEDAVPEAQEENNITAPEEERVEVRIPRGSEHGDPNVFVGINGTNYILPRGKTSKVPRFVKEEFGRSGGDHGRKQEHHDQHRREQVRKSAGDAHAGSRRRIPGGDVIENIGYHLPG